MKNDFDRWHDISSEDLIGTRAEREELFEYLVAATQRRQAISPAKNRIFGIDVARDMGRFRPALVGARTPAEMWYALVALSNTRHDRHLRLRPVEGGLPIPDRVVATRIQNYAALDENPAPRIGLRLATDFSGKRPFLFLAGKAEGIELPPGLQEGARLVAVNGQDFDRYVDAVEPYFCYSTPPFFWYHLPEHLVRKSGDLPDAFYQDTLALSFATCGAVATVELPYGPPDRLSWPAAPGRYEGWLPGPACESYRLFRHPERKVLALDWHGFGNTIVRDIDALMEYSTAQGLLSHDIIFDACRCRGGNFGGYLLQRLADRPFRINFGDLRLSDAIPGVIEEVLAEDRDELASGELNADQMRGARWRRDWLETDVRAALAAGQAVTAAVPFKCAHQPKDGDGMLSPAPVHFSGRIACITMPFGGSHIDQVVAQLVDNGLCTQIGMPLGGFSKTWVGQETLRLSSGRPLVQFEWSCGNTIRPNGEVLESNPPQPDLPLPQTRDNFKSHHALLVDAALKVFSRRETSTRRAAETQDAR